MNRRAEQVTTNRKLVMVFSDEVKRCLNLKKLQEVAPGKVLLRHVFHNILDEPFKYTQGHERDGAWVPAYFSHWPSEKSGRAPARGLSKEHEDAVANAGKLVLRNQLRVFKTCTHSSHKPLESAGFPDWLPSDHAECCVEALTLGILHDPPPPPEEEPSWTTAISHRWVTPTDKVFEIDLAILRNGKLHTAIEIQYTHANSAEKRAAFAEYRIVDIQIEAKELNRACKSRDWEHDDDPVLVMNHPLTAADGLWRCGPCELLYKTETKRKKALALKAATLQKKRDAYEKPLLTTFSTLEQGKWLKGFLYIPSPRIDFHYDGLEPERKKKKSEWFCVFLTESAYDYKRNPHPRRFKLMVQEHNREFLVDEHAACVKLERVSNDNFMGNSSKLMWIRGAWRPDLVVLGLDIPGYVDSLASTNII